jgi:hypothetical protein
MALLSDVLQASGGLDLWRQMRRFTIHLSIGGALFARKCGATQRSIGEPGCTSGLNKPLLNPRLYPM